MKPEHLETLLWEFRDGTITEKNQAELGEYVGNHPEARELEREIELLAERLGELGRVVPPRNLRARIAGALEDLPIPAHETRTSSSATIPRITKNRPIHWLPMAASLLVGVAVGFILQPGAGSSIDVSNAAGAMSTTAVKSSVEKWGVALGEQSGSVSISRDGGSATIDIELVAETDLEIDLETADGLVLLTGVDPTVTAGIEATTAPGRTVVRARGPATHRLEFLSTIDEAPVHLVIRADGTVVAEKWLTGKAEGNGG